MSLGNARLICVMRSFGRGDIVQILALFEIQHFCVNSVDGTQVCPWRWIMHFRNRTWDIEVIPQFSLGRYFARARIESCQDLSEAGLDEVHESGDLGDFGREADAIAYAHKWAIDWIDEHVNPVVCRKGKD
jgi:hypothetical protein